jgi:replication factor C subunit 1
MLWVDKFKPTSIQQIIGNSQSVKSLVEFLESWNASQKQKAALMSGPPGIGKTTTATLISNLCGFEVVEFNASDTRNQKSLDEHVSDLMDNRTITEFQDKKQGKERAHKSKKLVLVMDEVDGMSSGDRGGIAQLNKLIKTSKV